MLRILPSHARLHLSESCGQTISSTVTIKFDCKIRIESHPSMPQSLLWLKEVVTENSGFTVELSSNAVYPVAAASVAGSVRASQSFFPQYLLAFALSRAGSLRWLGVENYKGHKQNVIAFSPGDSPLALYFDAKTNLLTKYESLGDSITFGVARLNLGLPKRAGWHTRRARSALLCLLRELRPDASRLPQSFQPTRS